MSWAIGYDNRWNRDIGYGVPAYCDHPGCTEEIDRGLAWVCCGSEPYGGENGCGRYFCANHRAFTYVDLNDNETDDADILTCAHEDEDHISADHPEWVAHKLTDPSWQSWREEYPEVVQQLEDRYYWAMRGLWMFGGGLP